MPTDAKSRCQAANGTAPAAFLDPCVSPGPVVIPYANFTSAPKIRKGSRTVFIKGKQVALADKSYFVTSTGNEPATPGLSKGVVSHVIRGKAYFCSWSMNVKIEGYGVPRHLDWVTHNHGSAIGNTPPFPYMSSAASSLVCKDDVERINNECATDEGEHWTERYCDRLQVKPGNTAPNTKKLEQALANRRSELAALNARQSNISTEVQKQLSDLNAKLQHLDSKFANEITDRANNITKRLHGKMLSEEQKYKLSAKVISKHCTKLSADDFGTLATLNACTRALRCRLVPYKSSYNDNKSETNKTWGVSARNKGCCPGQTGHHLIYGVMAEDAGCPPFDKSKKESRGYHYDHAPTVCVEGTDQHHGTHGLVHDKMDTIVGNMAANGYVDAQGNHQRLGADGKMNLAETIEAAAKSHTEAFPLSGCSKECIKAQLHDYYGKNCPNGRFATVDKNGREHKLGDAEFSE